jgi:hypothetical protein
MKIIPPSPFEKRGWGELEGILDSLIYMIYRMPPGEIIFCLVYCKQDAKATYPRHVI